MTDKLDTTLGELFDRGERLGVSKWVSKDERSAAILEAKSAIHRMIVEAKIRQLDFLIGWCDPETGIAQFDVRGLQDLKSQLDKENE